MEGSAYFRPKLVRLEHSSFSQENEQYDRFRGEHVRFQSSRFKPAELLSWPVYSGPEGKFSQRTIE